jgi:hypothetical protein
MDSGLHRALRRVQARRAAAHAAGEPVPGRERIEATFREAQAAGPCGKRRKTVVRLALDPREVERALWWTGARTVPELVVYALLRVVLRDRQSSLRTRLDLRRLRKRQRARRNPMAVSRRGSRSSGVDHPERS